MNKSVVLHLVKYYYLIYIFACFLRPHNMCNSFCHRETQVLALSPTRELAVQIQKVILALGDYMSVQCHACIGGQSIGEDIRKLDYGQHVVSGTPGRVFDMIQRRNLRTRFVVTNNSFQNKNNNALCWHLAFQQTCDMFYTIYSSPLS